MRKEIKIGNKVRDKVSGIEGIATSRTEHLNGCIQFGVTPPAKSDSTEIPTWNIDEGQLEYVDIGLYEEKPKSKSKKEAPGGPITKFHRR